jgi:hypothetical protein
VCAVTQNRNQRTSVTPGALPQALSVATRLGWKKDAGFKLRKRKTIMMKTKTKPLGLLSVTLAFMLLAGSLPASAADYSNGFESDIFDWDAIAGLEATRVASGNNGITSASGSFHAENASLGSFSRWGGYNYGAGNAVPTVFHEYSTSVDIYLNVTGGWANDTRFDFDSAINNALGTFKRDFIFNAGFYNDADGSPGSGSARFVVSASNNSQPGSAYAKNPGRGPFAISTTGWYTFQHHFYNLAGVLAVDLKIFDSSQVLVNSWTLSDSTDSIAGIGGNRYGWFDYNQFSTLAFDNAVRADIPPVSSDSIVTPCSPVFDANDVVGVPGDAAPGFGTGSLASHGISKTDMYFTPEALFGRALKVGQVKSMSYWTKKGNTHVVDAADWFLNIYTKPFVGDVSTPTWYGSRFGSEPYFSINLAETADAWNQWTTDVANNQLRFFESTQGAPGATFGSYTDPEWTTFIAGNSLGTTVPRKNQEVLFFSIQTGSAWAAGFMGQVDGVTIEIYDGSVATINFEASAVASGTVVTPNPVAYNYLGNLTVTASITTGDCAAIVGAQFSVNGGSWKSMTATDSTFNSASEGVTGTFTLGDASIAAPGVYDVCVRGYDSAGNVSNEDCILLAVYDPNGGFVTGGGWIDSPAGAYTSDADLVGKATFGFVSQYKKGVSIPTGSTEFQFDVADLNFHSSVYQWLVVSGPRAQYKGTGQINNAGNYGFLLTATDGQVTGGGGVDKFRIKIWDINNLGAIVYDNALGASDDIDLANPQAIGGGSIVIHKK